MKTIFIPQDYLNSFNLSIEYSADELCFYTRVYDNDIRITKDLAYCILLGLVNLILEDKANAKKVISVDIYQKDNDNNLMFLGYNHVWEGFTLGYNVTYLESEMIATESDLESAWSAGESEGSEDGLAGGMSINNLRVGVTFYDWFDQYKKVK